MKNDYKSKIVKLVQYEPGEAVIREGEYDSWIFWVLRGKYRVKKGDINIAVFKMPGDVFGEMSALEVDTRSASVIAETLGVCFSMDLSIVNHLQNHTIRLKIQEGIQHLKSERLALTTEKLAAEKYKILEQQAKILQEKNRLQAKEQELEQREQALIQNMDVLKNLKVAGDWLVYSEILKAGKIAFTAKSLNFHRRHSESVTISFDNNLQHMSEILYMHDRIAKIIPISEKSKSKAKDFAGFAYKYLDLETAEYPTPRHNTSVQAILSGIED